MFISVRDSKCLDYGQEMVSKKPKMKEKALHLGHFIPNSRLYRWLSNSYKVEQGKSVGPMYVPPFSRCFKLKGIVIVSPVDYNPFGLVFVRDIKYVKTNVTVCTVRI